MICSRTTGLIRHVMRKRNATVFVYIDDTIGCGTADVIHDPFNYLLRLLEELNFLISHEKLVASTTECLCLGLVINTVKRTVSVTEDKLEEIWDKCWSLYQATVVFRRQLQSMISSLMFVDKAVKPTRFFVNRLLHALRETKHKIHVSDKM